MNKSRNPLNRIREILLILLPAILLAFLAYTALSGGPDDLKQPAPEDPDTTPPALFLTRDEDYFVLPGEQYEEEGYAAYDDRDGDLTKKVEVSVNGDTVRYRVVDSSGNITVRFRQIPYGDNAGGESR
ncbi:MAG: hypothetical protein Q4C02_06580 [Eubacteriales bacterium]|nr:DUF5011 domain-containing protein [Lachnospiraceae bacterium]MDO4417928.1 hypothetical protein [Eubacteriales bacterium]